MESQKKSNRLVRETSPYLLQHAYNPVDWHPWGVEALAEARSKDKPVLLSIGYSACHWCHVMERESFEDGDVARLMNELFVNIKVDREERPDLDAVYMSYVQMTTGSGGWPLTVFLTPDQVPFYGGTYFPPEDHYGRPSFRTVLEQVASAYSNRRSELEKMAPEIIAKLKESARFSLPESPLRVEIFDEAYRAASKSFDSRHGGFGTAPKFPSSMVLAFLLRYHLRTGSKQALAMVNKSLQEMVRGGIYDQLGGGFHRYSVDDRWLVPHFEKMLYDNALLVRVLLEASQATGNLLYRQVASETLSYVTREMTDSEGGFYSSQDADSEGEEGKYFVWKRSEIAGVLDEKEADLFCDYFGVSSAGNFEGGNILQARYEPASFAGLHQLDPEAFSAELARWKQLLFQRREQRPKPGLDDKVLASWNGLMLTAFSQASVVLGQDALLGTAVSNARFLTTQMIHGGRLRRTWKQGTARLDAYLEDYAHVIEGFICLFEASGETAWLQEADQLMRLQLELFWDEAEGDFFFTARDHEQLLVRQKEFMDNATPSGNSTSCCNLLRLGHLTANQHYRECGERLLRRMGLAMARHPLAFGNWLQALDFYFGPVQEIVVVGPPDERRNLLRPVASRLLPNKLLVQSERGLPEALLPMLRGRERLGEGAALHSCEDNTCGLPMTDRAEVETWLANRRVSDPLHE